MKAIIETISPNGFTVSFETEFDQLELDKLLATLPKIEMALTEAGYMANSERHYPKTPDGLPICPKHGEVMREREKQGDTWYSHVVDGPNGEKFYCRGHAGKNSPGWEH